MAVSCLGGHAINIFYYKKFVNLKSGNELNFLIYNFVKNVL